MFCVSVAAFIAFIMTF